MMDPVSLQTMPAFPAHMAGMCDMDVVGNYLVTCGLVQRCVTHPAHINLAMDFIL